MRSLFLLSLVFFGFSALNADAASGYFIKVNTHTHTAWDNTNGYGSDGRNTLAEMVDAYKSKGYNLLVITDHNSYDGTKTSSLTQGYFVNRVNPFTPCDSYSDPANKFLCISGEELTPGIGVFGDHAHHALLVGGKKPWTNFDDNADNIKKAFSSTISQGGFAVIAHPSSKNPLYDHKGFKLADNETYWTLPELKSFDYTAMEISATTSVAWWDEVLKSKLDRKVFGILGDDAHSAAAAGKKWIQAYVAELSKEAFLNAVNQGYFYSSTGPSMNSDAFSFKCDNGTTYNMGQTIGTIECGKGKFKAGVVASASNAFVKNIKIIKNGAVIYNKTDCPKAQQCSFEFPQTIKDAAYYRMEATDSAGKSLWSNPIWSVVESARVAVCANDCASGTKQCSGNGVQTCGNYDTDSCLEWSLPTPCSSGQICSSGSCSAASCTGECSESGTKQCSGNGVQTCGNYDTDSCLEWSAAVNCASGQTCSQGVCVAACANDCASGTKQCSGNGVQTCGNYDTDSCLEWSLPTPCSSGQICSSGSCSAASCTGECSESGTKQCSGNGVQTCGNYDTDSCLEWSLPTPCSSGQICSSGSCSAASCTGECSESGANSSDYDIDSADQVCPNGVCSNLDYIQSQINVIQKAISRLFDLLAALREGR